MQRLLWVFLLTLPAFADRIHLKDDRVIEGKAKQDGDYWVIKTKLGSIRVHKDEVIRIDETSDGGTPEASPTSTGESKAGGSFQSSREGFSFHIKGPGWRVEAPPPRPMVSALAVNDEIGVEIAVVRLEDAESAVPLAEEAAKSLKPTVQALISVVTLEPANLKMERYPLSSGPAFVWRAEGRRRLSKVDLLFRSVLLKSGGKLWIVQYQAPAGAPSSAEKALEDLLDSFQVGAPAGTASPSDVFTSGPMAFSIGRPEGWDLNGKEGEGSATVSLSARDGSVEATLDAKDLSYELDLRQACTAMAERLGREMSSFEAGVEEMKTIANRMARLFAFTYRRDGEPRGGVAIVTREGTRVFELIVRAPDEPAARAGVEKVMAGFRVIKEEASVKPSADAMQALKTLQEADKLYVSGDYKSSQAVYRKATQEWPNFADALLMLARTSLSREEMDEAVTSAEAARRLLPGRIESAEVLAWARARKAKVLAKSKEYAKAAEELVKAASLKVTTDRLTTELGEAAVAFTEGVKQPEYDKVREALKKAHDAFPEDSAILSEYVRVCRWLCKGEIEAKNWAKAERYVDEGLRAKPNDRNLTELREQVQKGKAGGK